MRSFGGGGGGRETSLEYCGFKGDTLWWIYFLVLILFLTCDIGSLGRGLIVQQNVTGQGGVFFPRPMF